VTAKPWVHNTRRRPVLERFWEKVDRSGGPDACWPWLAGKNPDTGYGVFHPEHGHSVSAHRFAYEAEVGPVPKGKVIDHLCHVDLSCPGGRLCAHRACVNPKHLGPETNEDNLRRGKGYRVANGLTDMCTRGHKYTPENTYYQPSRPHIARCRECARMLRRKAA
jgi:hypothetical protein